MKRLFVEKVRPHLIVRGEELSASVLDPFISRGYVIADILPMNEKVKIGCCQVLITVFKCFVSFFGLCVIWVILLVLVLEYMLSVDKSSVFKGDSGMRPYQLGKVDFGVDVKLFGTISKWIMSSKFH